MQTQREKQFKGWVEDHSDILYGYCLRRTADAELAKDLVQETFLAAWRNREAYKGEASEKNWLFVILKSKLIDHYRKLANKATLEAIAQEHNDVVYFDGEDHWRKGMYPKDRRVSFSQPVEVKEFYAIFRSCGKKLKELQYSVFVMKYVDGLESEEICKVLGLTSSNYWVLVHRAKVQLRACLEKNWMKS